MGLFWDYFKNKLRFPLIWNPGPLAVVVEGAASKLDAVREHILWLRDQFLAERCDTGFLTDYAKSRGIIRASFEPEKHYLGRIRFAYSWWATGGRSASMAQALVDYYGFAEVTVVSLRDEDPLRWAEFRVSIDVIGGYLEVTQSQVEWAINEMKPARSKLAEVLYTFSTEGAVPVVAVGLQSSEIITVYPQEA